MRKGVTSQIIHQFVVAEEKNIMQVTKLLDHIGIESFTLLLLAPWLQKHISPKTPVLILIISTSINSNSSENVLAHMKLRAFRLQVDGMRNNMQTLSSLSHLLSYQGLQSPSLKPKDWGCLERYSFIRLNVGTNRALGWNGVCPVFP